MTKINAYTFLSVVEELGRNILVLVDNTEGQAAARSIIRADICSDIAWCLS